MSGSFTRAFSGAFDTVPPAGAWEPLLGFIQEARDIDQQDRSTAPTSCPVCYTALREGPDSTLYCPWADGHPVWPGDAGAWGEFPGSY